MAHKTVYDHALATVRAHEMAGADAFAVAMVSGGGSDSCALAYMVADMVAAGELGAAVMLHVNHKLRGEASEGDARFVASWRKRSAYRCSCARNRRVGARATRWQYGGHRARRAV